MPGNLKLAGNESRQGQSSVYLYFFLVMMNMNDVLCMQKIQLHCTSVAKDEASLLALLASYAFRLLT